MFERDEKCKKILVGMAEGKKHLEDPDVDVKILLQHFLCLWFYIHTCPTRCNKKQSIYYSASSLYMFRASNTPIIKNTWNCNYNLRYWS